MESSSDILYEKNGQTGMVTINRPDQGNAIKTTMLHQLTEIFGEARRDPDVHVLVITGSGTKAFSVGQDLQEMLAILEVGENTFKDTFWDATGFDSIMTDDTFNKPVISAINGHCIGYGLTLALSSDIRIASDQARFGYPEVKIGTPTVIGAIRLPRIAALGPAMELLLTGDLVPADEAYRLGLINRLLEPDQVLESAMELAERLSRYDQVALRATKEIAVSGLGKGFHDAWRRGEAIRALSIDFKKLYDDVQAYINQK